MEENTRMLNVIDGFSRAWLAIRVARRFRRTDVFDALSDLFILRGKPYSLRRRPEFVARNGRIRIGRKCCMGRRARELYGPVRLGVERNAPQCSLLSAPLRRASLACS